MTVRLTSVITIVLVLCLGCAGGAAAAKNGTYLGKTKGEYPVKVKVKNNRVTLFDASVYASCGFSNFGIKFVFPPAGRKGATAKIKGNGSFKAVFKGSPDLSFADDKRTLKGRFRGNRVTGTMKVEGLCSADTTFSAKR